MLCDVCGNNEAKVHLAEVVKGKMKKVDLCESCAKEKRIDDPTGFSLMDMLTGIEAVQGAETATPKAGRATECRFCGYTQAEFKKTGRLGCAHCYEVFEEGLEQVFKTMHRGVRHKGKVPEKLRNSQELQNRLRELQERLDKAVEHEKFEEAAVIRDELKVVREEIEKLSSGPQSDDETV
ncbi:MAG: Protein-arginine kinase activator protein [Verrucomicrobia subdivision 3 bacterium]|nr:Protein-arginine kinase activator protein [Limisphaerales bacterium]MCS1416162.1 Protein-arginine kinase activator protein [Limisphaerales bacterium]